MMKITNKLNLPQPIVDAVSGHEYTGKTDPLSVTTLINPVRQYMLRRRHADDLTEDVSDRIYALMGSAIHAVLEKSDRLAIKEKRLSAEINGMTITGQFDRLALISTNGGIAGQLQDYKIASVWEAIYGLKPDKVQQLNLYALLCAENEYKVNSLQIVMIFRDWQKSKSKHDSQYPQGQVKIFQVELWPLEKQLAFATGRVKTFQACINNDVLPECTSEERWHTPDKWAVMKPGRKTALRLLPSEILANQYIDQKELTKCVVEKRPGANKRCDDYCDVAPFCEQYKRE